MRLKLLTTLLLCLTFSATAFAVSVNDPVQTSFSSNPFPDTDINMQEGVAAAELQRREVIGGYPDGSFQGNNNVNRAEAAKFLMLAKYGNSGVSSSTASRFPDTPSGEWYIPYVNKTAELGIINGYPDGTFKPGNTINTAEFLKMITLTFGLEQNLPHAYNDVFPNDWFTPYAGVAQKYTLYPHRTGGYLRPSQYMTRYEVAVAIYQILKANYGSTASTTPTIPSVTTTSCNYNGKTYSDGKTFKSSDNCSSCTCDDGHVLCEAKTCSSAFDTETVTLKVGESITNGEGDKAEFNSFVFEKNSEIPDSACFDFSTIFNGVLSNLRGACLSKTTYGSILPFNGFYFKLKTFNFVQRNSPNNSITFTSNDSCLNFYNQCLLGNINNNIDSNTSDLEFQCSKLCEKEPSPVEYLYDTVGKIKGIFPKEFKDYGIFLVDNYKNDYEKLKTYLGFDIQQNELFIRLFITDDEGISAGAGETIKIYQTKNYINTSGKELMQSSSHTGAGIHEFTHIFTYNTIIAPSSYYDDTSDGLVWIFEGLANYMQNFNPSLVGKYNPIQVTCYDDGYKYPNQEKKSFLDLSQKNLGYSDGSYTTGACFWDYIYKEFGEVKFKALLKYISTTRHDVGVYNLFDEFKKILGKDISDIAHQRFGFDKDMTVKIFL